MEINASVKFKYWSGNTSYTSPERLSMEITFKEPNRLFRQKIKKDIICKSNKYLSYEDYLEHVKIFLNDHTKIKSEVEDMIKQYFYKKEKSENKKLLVIRKKIYEINNEKNNIKVNVKIEEYRGNK